MWWLVAASLLVNEVRYDPPGSDVGGEFVELLNRGEDPIVLDPTWQLQRGNGGAASGLDYGLDRGRPHPGAV